MELPICWHFFGDLHTKPLGSFSLVFWKAAALIASAVLPMAIFYLNKKVNTKELKNK